MVFEGGGMFGKPIAQATDSDIIRLKADSVPEGRHLDDQFGSFLDTVSRDVGNCDLSTFAGK
jgi:hypothetical protein